MLLKVIIGIACVGLLFALFDKWILTPALLKIKTPPQAEAVRYVPSHLLDDGTIEMKIDYRL